MYNEIVKQNYIDENGFQYKSLQYYFNTVAPTEEKLGKDVYDFSAQDLINFYKYLCRSSYNVLRVFHYTFKSYTNWALSKQMVSDNMNHSLEITSEILSSCVHKGRFDDQVITREALLSDLSGLPNPSDCFLILSLFEGVCSNRMTELHNLTMDDIDKKQKLITIKKTGRQVSVSDELIDYANKAAHEFMKYEQKCTSYGEYYYDLDDPKPKYDEADMNIIKAQYNVDPYQDTDERFTRRMRNTLVLIQNVLERAVYTPSAIAHSGRIHYIRSIYDGIMPMQEFVRGHYEDIADRYGDFKVKELCERYSEYLNAKGSRDE